MQKKKSATTAGLLGVFLGSVGVHNWYLGQKFRGTLHVLLALAGVLLVFIAVTMDVYSSSSYYYYTVSAPSTAATITYSVGAIMLMANAIWGFVEGIIILARGDSPARHTSAAPNAQADASAQSPSSKAATKANKKIVLGVCLGIGALILLTVGSFVLVMLTRVDYSESYRAARDLKTYISKIANNTDCENVIYYADSSWVSEKAYAKYIENCKKSTTRDDELVEALGDSSAVRKDSKISAQFDKFKSAYETAVSDQTDLTDQLDLYQAWHKFIVLSGDLSMKSSEKDFRSAIEPLQKSGNSTLENYAEGWLEHTLAYRQAYDAYWSNSSAGSAERDAMNAAQDALDDWIDDNEIDMTEIADLDSSDTDDLIDEFDTLYDLIAEAYEENYNYDSGDCTELFNSVYCD